MFRFANKSRLLYLGGPSNTFEMGQRTIFEYEGEGGGWRKWPNELPLPVSDQFPFTEIDVDFCIEDNVQNTKRFWGPIDDGFSGHFVKRKTNITNIGSTEDILELKRKMQQVAIS